MTTIIEAVAKALIINEKNEALILTIGEYKEHPEKSYTPDLPGGQVDFGESERDAVVREINEEAGIVVALNDARQVFSETVFYPEENKSVSKHLYVVKLDYTPEVTVSWEHATYEWKSLSTLLETTEFRSFYEKAIRYTIEHELIG